MRPFVAAVERGDERGPARVGGVDQIGVTGRGVGEVDGEAVGKALVEAFGGDVGTEAHGGDAGEVVAQRRQLGEDGIALAWRDVGAKLAGTMQIPSPDPPPALHLTR